MRFPVGHCEKCGRYFKLEGAFIPPEESLLMSEDEMKPKIVALQLSERILSVICRKCQFVSPLGDDLRRSCKEYLDAF